MARIPKVALAALGAGVVVVRKALAAAGPGRLPMVRSEDPTRWHAVTVNLPIDEVIPGRRLPQPLAELGDEVEVRVRPAPDAKGTELHARPVAAGTATDGNAEASAETGPSTDRSTGTSADSGPSAGGNGVGPGPGFAVREQVRRIRAALRTSKQILETGEVLSPDRPGTTRPTPLNAPLRYVTAQGREEGRL